VVGQLWANAKVQPAGIFKIEFWRFDPEEQLKDFPWYFLSFCFSILGL